jgi:hypothetical protein
MSGAQVRVVDESISARKSGLVIGVVYVDFGPFQFPGPKWDDFVVVILGWWLTARVDLLRGTASQIELRFMDGPLWISIQKQAADLCTMKCIKDDCVQYECEGSPLDLLKSTLEAAGRVHGICTERGWKSRDIDMLGQAIAAGRLLAGLH